MVPSVDEPVDRFGIELDAICSDGEPITPEIHDGARRELDGIVVNELYRQTEANLLVINCRD